ncbi:5-oxoprolinase subunit PxpB [Salibacterium aidingense]|uniref:5-oxoprolinase subunit PxpB n=1 Tax=Salibacterium aidingense TaxID=384933 RepID=UPI0003FF3EB6|nr:5-oxoprolinase subunit PxpB [Salibacterium aidingense]
MEPLRINMLSDRALRVEFGTTISAQTNQWIRAFCWELEKKKYGGIKEWVPAYTAVTLYYDPANLSLQELEQLVYAACASIENDNMPAPSSVTIPVCYGGEFGPDLEKVAEHNQLTVEQVVWLHTEGEYLIYMMGFMPGFPYLGGLNEKIATPRLATPRSHVPAGSVGIANAQTGIYPLESPGGWNLIGRTPESLFQPEKEDPVILEAGTVLRFKAISKQEYWEMEKQKEGAHESNDRS